jgi:TetR/AcrR family transcriptional regulator, regulator of autoinduction and epiphytic fitness
MVTRRSRSAPPSPETSEPKRSFRQQMLQAREEAIIAAVNRLLAEKGFDAMTVDEVAAEVGIAKASLYKHFPSKEDLAAAAMVHVMNRAHAFLDTLDDSRPPLELLREMARWMMQVQLAGEMPSLPSENSSLRTTLMQNKAYMDGLLRGSDRLGAWIEAARADGSLNTALPPLVILYTLYARACDPVLGFLKASELYTDEQIVELVLTTCFDGLKK